MFSGFMINAWEVGTIVAIVAGVVGLLRRASRAPRSRRTPSPTAPSPAPPAPTWSASTRLSVSASSPPCRPRHRLARPTGPADVATALALVMMLALGAAFLSQSTQYEPEIFSLLFGEILGVSTTEILPVALSGSSASLAVVLLYRPLMLTSLVPEIAAARGVRPHRMEIGFLLVVAARDHDDGAGRRGAPDLHADDRPAGGGALPSPTGPVPAIAALRRPRARHGVGGDRLLVPVRTGPSGSSWASTARGVTPSAVPGSAWAGAAAPAAAGALSRRTGGNRRRPGVGGGHRRHPGPRR